MVAFFVRGSVDLQWSINILYYSKQKNAFWSGLEHLTRSTERALRHRAATPGAGAQGVLRGGGLKAALGVRGSGKREGSLNAAIVGTARLWLAGS